MKISEHYDYETNDIELLDQLQIQFALCNYCKFKSVMKGLEDKINYINDQKHTLPSGIVKKSEALFSKKPNKLLDLMEKEQILLAKYKGYQYYIDLTDNFVASLRGIEKELVIDRYYFGNSWITIESKYNFSSRQLNRMIKNMIKMYCLNTF